MTVRTANFSDIPGIFTLLQEGYARSHYARDGRTSIDTREAKRLLVQAVQRHGHTTGGGCFVEVSEVDGQICGLILGTLSRVYAIGDRLSASDIFWLTNSQADPGDAMQLMRGFVGWAKSNQHVVEIKCGTTAAINEDPEAAGLILRRIGMQKYGNIYRMEA